MIFANVQSFSKVGGEVALASSFRRFQAILPCEVVPRLTSLMILQLKEVLLRCRLVTWYLSCHPPPVSVKQRLWARGDPGVQYRQG